jgi:hypothetical protein
MLRRMAVVRTDVSEGRFHSYVLFHGALRRLLITSNIVPSLQILFALIMEAINSSETLVLAKGTRRNIPEDGILHANFQPDIMQQ